METEKKAYNFSTYGVGTPRYRSYVLINPNELLLPLGPNLILWDLQTKSKRFLSVTQSVIMSILPMDSSNRHVITASYNGEIALIDTTKLEVISIFKAKGSCLRHASLYNDRLLVCNEEYEKFKGLSEVIDLKTPGFQCLWNLKGQLRFGEILSNNNKVFVLRKNHLKVEQLKELDIPSITSSKGSNNKKKHFNYYMELYDIGGSKSDIPMNSVLLPEICEIIASGLSDDRQLLGLMYTNRTILVIKPDSLMRIFNFKIHGSGAIMSFFFSDNNMICLCPKKDTLMSIDCRKTAQEKIPEIVILDEIKAESGLIVDKFKSDAFSEGNFMSTLNNIRKTYISFNSDGLHIYDFQSKKTESFSLAGITLCGVGLNPEGTLLATGDFLGNILIFSTNIIDTEPIYTNNFESGIRSIVWGHLTSDEVGKGPYIIVGCMDGAIFQWYYTNFEEIAISLTPGLQGSITCLKLFSNKGVPPLLLASTTSGCLGIYINDDGTFHLLKSFEAHKPQKDHDKEAFGSLGKFAEIWSNSWDPKSDLKRLGFATTSEDQTCVVWELKNSNIKDIAVLKGHTRAVTSVDWQIMAKDIGEILITCSDDRTLRVYDVEQNFKLSEEIVIDFIKEWFTLTYLSLEKGGNRVACVAQNGYLFVYDLRTKKFEFAERVHLGSVEGLIWGDNGKLVSCAADLTVQVTAI